MLKPRPLSLGLAALFCMAICLDGSTQYALPLTLAYFFLLNLVCESEAVAIDMGQEIDDSFISSFANSLVALGPEQAFVEALGKKPSTPLLSAIYKMRNGIPLTEALLCLRVRSKSEKALLTSASRALSYDSNEASERLKKYLRYRQERRKFITEYMGKMAVLSLRLRALSAISAASLAVIAFATPLLGALSKGGSVGTQNSILAGGIFPIIAFFTVSVLSPFLYSRTVPNTRGTKIAAFCGTLFVITFLSLALMFGSRF